MGNLLIPKREKNINGYELESFSISNKHGFISQNEFFRNGGIAISADKRNSILVKNNYFAYNPARINIGSIGLYKSSKIGLVSPLYEVFVSNDLVNNDWLFIWFKSKHFNKIVERKKAGSVRQTINLNDISDDQIIIPSFYEQCNIATTFQSLNSLITLHQRELKILKNFKKSLFVKMNVGKNLTILPAALTKKTNVWEQERFNNLYIFASEGGTPSTFVEEYYKNGKIPFVKIEDTLKKYIYSTKNFITELGLNKSSAWIIKKDNIIFTNGATVGNISINKIDLSTKQGILGIILKENFNVEFIYYLLNTINFKNKINQIKTKGTFDILTLNNIDTIKINIINNKNEQLNISNLLSKIDSLITLHQRELKILKSFKKSLFQKMIAGKNLTILLAALTKMTNVWEQEKIENICDRFDNYRIPISEKNRIKGNTPYYGANGIQDYVKGYTHSGENILIAEDGVNDVNNYSILYVNEKIWVNNHAHVIKASNKLNNNFFISLSLKRVDWSSLLVGGERFKLNASTLMNIFIKICNTNEQNKISIIFNIINSLITLHQRKLNALENLKKTLLEKMFPSENSVFPSIRFKEFTNAWEQERLGNLSDIKSGDFVIKIKQSPIFKFPVYNGGSTYTGFYKEFNFLGPKVVISSRGAAGSVNYVKSNFWAGNSVFVLDFMKDKMVNLFFSYILLKNLEFKMRSMISSTGIPALSVKDVCKIKLFLCNLNEQQRIGNIFLLINSLIALHQRKLKILKSFKKSLFVKMIVGKNLTILSATLTKMTNVWEQERLGNLCEQAKSRAVITDIKSRGKYDLYGVNGFIGKTNLTPINNGKKAILVVVDGSVGKTLILPPNSFFTSTLEALYIKEGFLIDFLFNSLKTEQLLKFSTGSIIKHLYFNEYRGINILVPNLKEQNKISIIFNNINSLIALHQRELKILKIFKKSLLQKMIVGKNLTILSMSLTKMTNVWEQEKIGNIFTITRGYVLGKEKISLEKNAYFKYPVFSSQTGNNGLMGYYNSYLFDKAITWTTDGIYAGDVNYRDEKFYCTNVCGVLLNNDGYINLCNAISINKVSKKHVTKVGNPKLMNNVMKEILFSYSNNLKEQTNISIIFNNINSLITLHQRGQFRRENEKKIRNFVL
ncbi:restriction endonuclease subunit S [Mycoplasmopsis cynos]|uniref:restriction endonuclease subunit S n=1 Tax=Mycoplasmopsis cynos TaxID=171284 RepID=UPI0002FD84C1|nr:restriction endonuclease subunit S [Mycoplasmopsis cynos]